MISREAVADGTCCRIALAFLSFQFAHSTAHANQGFWFEGIERAHIKISQHTELDHRETVGVTVQSSCDAPLANLPFNGRKRRVYCAPDDCLVAFCSEVAAREFVQRRPLEQHHDLKDDLGLAHVTIIQMHNVCAISA